MKLSIIIPCYNAEAYIGEQLEALSQQEWNHPWEVLISDNGSRDGSLKVVERYRDRLPHLRIIDASGRKGGAYARNLAASQAQGESIAFIDADDVIAPGWLAAIGNALEQHPFVASRFDIERLNHDSWLNQLRTNPQDTGLQRIGYPPHLPHSGGCGLGVRRSLHTQVGGFDEQLMRLMDTDYCFRIQLQCQVELTFVPAAVVYVRYRDTLRGMFKQTRERAVHNIYLSERYRPAGQPRKVLGAWYSFAKRWMRHWWRLVTQVRSREQFAAWLRVLGWHIGLLQGSLKLRIPPPSI